MNDSLKRTPLADSHVKLGGRMVDFGGWYMPVQYKGVVDEHMAVRHKVGLFDVSHMGEIRVRGEGTEAFLNSITTNDVTRVADGQAQYTVLTNEDGGVLDDLLIYRFSHDHYLLVVNAGTQDKDFAWISKHTGDHKVVVANESSDTGQIAIQGPLAEQVLQRLVSNPLDEVAYYHFVEANINGVTVLISRTGYTGEDGFECYLAAEQTPALWDLLLETGKDEGIEPCGLGARDTLRLESRMNLYGNDMDETTSVLEAGLGWAVKLKKEADFVGKAALIAQKRAKLTRKLVAFTLNDRGIARHGYPVVDEQGNEIGTVTSGSHSPSLKTSIGLAYVPMELSKAGSTIHIKIRKKIASAVVIKGPFYKRA